MNNELSIFGILLAVAMLLALCFGIGQGIYYGIVGFPKPDPPSAEQVWLSQVRERCAAMRSNLSYDEETGIAECFRTPLLRQPKLVFKEAFKP